MGVVCGAFSGLNAHYQLDALAAAFGHLRETAYAHHDDLMRRGLRQGGRQDVSRPGRRAVTVLLDPNVLIALVVADHVHHHAASPRAFDHGLAKLHADIADLVPSGSAIRSK